MLDFVGFLGQVCYQVYGVFVVFYFYENQFIYLWFLIDEDVKEQCDWYYVYFNFILVLVVDVVFFNFNYYCKVFLEVLFGFLWAFLDICGLFYLFGLVVKSEVLYFGLFFWVLKGDVCLVVGLLVILWNYCWEYDKGLLDFFQFFFCLQIEGLFFWLIVFGENYWGVLFIFVEVKVCLFVYILYWGYVESCQDYVCFLQ